ncbi:hypothetical protein V5799_011276 [Amblyomma americanum]|uniref:MADF domain-containing protein n=1 Tax=Amblyomma americanum TaxID=6943 RepID=A0AAQ4EIB9_AMBAM
MQVCAAPRTSLNRRLIAEVRKRPGLWGHRDDRWDRAQTQQAWFEIADALNGVSPELVRKRWKNLKDVFAKKYHALRKRQAASANKQSGVITEQWQYFKDLLFLRHTLRDVLATAAEQSGDEEMTNGLDAMSDTAENAREPAVDTNEDDTTTFFINLPVTPEIEVSSNSTPNEEGCVPKRSRELVVSEVRSLGGASSPLGGHEPPSTCGPRAAKISLQSSQQSNTARAPFNGTMEVRSAPIHMDHITHFLFSLESYIRKTSDQLQPQLQMELLNVASAYSQNVFPQLLFPRT